MNPPRLSRAEILKRYRACYRKLGRPPGWLAFAKATGVRPIDVHNYWPRINELAREAGTAPNRFNQPMQDEQLFREYARVCLHLKKIPNSNELRVANRKLGTRASAVYTKYGSIIDFDHRFLDWLIQGPEEFKSIISLPGWQRKGQLNPPRLLYPPLPVVSPLPFLPVLLQDLEALSHGTGLASNRSGDWASEVFRCRCLEAFVALGFLDIELGPPQGRELDFTFLICPFQVALAHGFHYGVLLDPQARSGDYVPPTGGPEYYERVRRHVSRLQQERVERTYLAVIGPSFRETDLDKLATYLRGAGLSGMTLFSASALMRIVADSIHERYRFTLSGFEKTLAGNRIVTS
jgi:hypothetical protein